MPAPPALCLSCVQKQQYKKSITQRDIKGLKLLSFALYQNLDGNQVQIPVFLGTIPICIKKVYTLNRNTTKHRKECNQDNKRTRKLEVNSIRVGLKREREFKR